MDTIRYIDLFCGLGAFHSAFLTNPKFKCVFACDIDKGIQKIYKDNYGLDVHGDIRTIQLDTFPAFDLLCAGFPCQPFSIAGNGEGFNDTEKGNLFYEILKLVDKGHPKMCILENVKNLKTHDHGNTYTKIETELQNRGYLVTSKVLNAADFGSPQARQRIFIVATKEYSFVIPDGTGIVNPVNTILDSTVQDTTLNLDKYELVVKQLVEKNRKKPKLLADVVDKQTKKGGRQGERVYDPTHVGITICASSGGPGAKTGLYKIGSNIRRLTVKESLGMFGFPSTYNFGTTPQESCLFYLGNSIVVDVIKAFVPRIVAWFAEANAS